ncbi:hypothetical protein JLBYU08_212 [Escherichia phage JLBYU08]|nr:hypothetical protein JLBYU08_212 [Escherichia phage JLBYU08]
MSWCACVPRFIHSFGCGVVFPAVLFGHKLYPSKQYNKIALVRGPVSPITLLYHI